MPSPFIVEQWREIDGDRETETETERHRETQRVRERIASPVSET